MHVDTVLEGVAKLRGNNAVTRADLARAIKALEPLGAGYTLLAGGTLVRCVQAEMDTDALAVLEVAAGEERPIVDEPKLRLARPAWPTERVRSAIDKAVVEGFLWVDDQAEGGRREFWAPSLVDFA